MPTKALKGFTLWFTGPPSSGKTTLAGMVYKELQQRGFKVELLDGEELRKTLWSDLTFTRADRDKNVERLGFICHILSRNGIIAIASAVSPYRDAREKNRKKIGAYVEVFVKCPISTCKERDSSGLYKRAENGLIQNFTGISDPYEEPQNPEIVVETDKKTPQESIADILKGLSELGYLDDKNTGHQKNEPTDEEKFSIDDEELIKKRLQDLGYL